MHSFVNGFYQEQGEKTYSSCDRLTISYMSEYLMPFLSRYREVISSHLRPYLQRWRITISQLYFAICPLCILLCTGRAYALWFLFSFKLGWHREFIVPFDDKFAFLFAWLFRNCLTVSQPLDRFATAWPFRNCLTAYAGLSDLFRIATLI